MDRLFQALRPLIRGVVRRPVLVLAAALLLTVVSVFFARHIRIDTNFAELLPEGRASVQALERLQETVGGESDVAVAIESPSLEANKRFAEALIPRALRLEQAGSGAPYFTRVAYHREEAAFLKDNALYFATAAELDTLEAYLERQIEQAALEANPFYFDVTEDDGAETDTTAQELQQVYQQLTVDEYMLSPDSTVLVVRFYPSGAQTDIGFIEEAYDALDALVADLEPDTFHPQMKITLAGRLFRQLVEIRAITRDVVGSLGAGIATVLLFVTLYFLYKAYRVRAGGRFDRRVLLAELARAPVLALVIGGPLLMSLAWTTGFAYLAFDTLNLFTATLGLVLFGLGIEFGIHYYARYAEERGAGRSVAEAAEVSFLSTGQAVTVGALATAAAFYVLMVAQFKGFSQFGAIAGTGILFALAAMIVVLPAFLIAFERLGLLNLTTGGLAAEGAPAEGAPGVRGRRFPAARGVAAGSLIAVAAALVLVFAGAVSFEYDFGTLEPEYEVWDARNDVVQRATEPGPGRNPAYVVLDDPSEAPAVVEAVRRQMARDTLSPTIQSVESLQMRFPLDEAARQAKLSRIAEIRALLTENRYLSRDTSAATERLRPAAQTEEAVTLAQVPDFLKKRFMTKSGEVGGFVMIYPSVGLSHGKQSIAFAEDVGTIVTAEGETYHAGSTSLVAADMLQLMLGEAPYMVLLTFAIVAALMYVNFRALRWTLLALVPLVVGILWMLLIMAVAGIQLNFYNIIVLPTMLGLGNEAGVHIVHRYREEGAGSLIRVLRSTGEHVTVGALTNMIGFGGLLLSFHPGLHSIGLLAVVGIGATLLAALLFLPALLQWLEDRDRMPADESGHIGDGQADRAPRAPEETAPAHP